MPLLRVAEVLAEDQSPGASVLGIAGVVCALASSEFPAALLSLRFAALSGILLSRFVSARCVATLQAVGKDIVEGLDQLA